MLEIFNTVNQPSKTIRPAGQPGGSFSRNPPWPAPRWRPARNLFITPVYGQTQAPAPGNVVGANNRIVVGYIGVGKQGDGCAHYTSKTKSAADNNIAQVAVCDLSDASPRCGQGQDRGGLQGPREF